MHKIDENRKAKDVINKSAFGVRESAGSVIEKTTSIDKFINGRAEDISNSDITTHQNPKVFGAVGREKGGPGGRDHPRTKVNLFS